MEKKIKRGDRIKIHFSGFDEDGEIVETTTDGEPKTVDIGENQLVQGLENALLGLKKGENKTIMVEAKFGFQDRHHPHYGKDIIYELKIVDILE